MKDDGKEDDQVICRRHGRIKTPTARTADSKGKR